MSRKETISAYLIEIKNKISLEMPRIINEVGVYERNLRNRQLTKKPKIAPQFNG